MLGFLLLITLAVMTHQSHSESVVYKHSEDLNLKSIQNQLDRLQDLYLAEKKQRINMEKKLEHLQKQCSNDNKKPKYRSVQPAAQRFPFHALLSQPLSNTNAEQILVFDSATINSKGSNVHQYSNSTGFFTCTVPGTYFFTWTTASGGPGEMVQTSIIQTGEWKGSQVAYDSFMAATSSVILNLQHGDQVWIQIDYSGSSVTQDLTTFSGFLLE